MKKRKHLWKILCFSLTVALLLGGSGAGMNFGIFTDIFFPTQKNVTKVALAAASIQVPYFFADPSNTGTKIESGRTISLESERLNLSVSYDPTDPNASPLFADSDIKYSSSNPEVVNVEAVAGDKRIITLVRKSPGYAQISAFMPDGCLLTLLVEVKLEVVKTDTTVWNNVTIANMKMLVLQVDQTYNTVVKYMNDYGAGVVDNALLEWSEDSEVGKIVDVNNQGVITAKGAGFATITITTQTYITVNGVTTHLTESFPVLVVPKAGKTYSATNAGYTPSIDVLKNESTFDLYTNTTSSQNLRWKVYKVDSNGTKKQLIKTNNADLSYSSDLLKFKLSTDSGTISFTDVKAGSYKIYGYVYDNLTGKEYDPTNQYSTIPHIEINLEVAFSITSQNLVMNVGNEYDIVEKSNIPLENLLTLFTFTSENSSVATVDNKGVVKAIRKGKTRILIHYDKDNAAALYANTGLYYTNIPTDIYFNITVIDGISLDKTSVTMFTGGEIIIEANATDRETTIYWHSSDPSVATVESGKVKALKAGETTITAVQTIDGVLKTASCKVIVSTSVSKIELSPKEVTLEIGDYQTIIATLTPKVSGVILHWVSSDESVFKVDSFNQATQTSNATCTIIANKAGSAVLTAINEENIVVGSCFVTVNQPATGIQVTPSSISLQLTQGTYQLYATVLPDNVTNANVNWESTNTSIATVDSKGLVTLKSAGSTSIIVTSVDNPGIRAVCNITVLKSVESIKLDKHSIEMYVGETYKLTYTITPSNASNTNVKWRTFNGNICVVSNNGMLTAVTAGTTQIMVMTEDGNMYSLCEVVVKQKATGVRMNVTNVTMNKGEYFDIDISVTPSTATEASLTWESQDSSIATVTSAGRVTAKSVGSTIIMVKTVTGATAYCNVTVLEGVTQLELDPQQATIDIGETLTISPIFTPASASNTKVSWKSSNTSVATINAAGTVMGLKGGVTVITCESDDGGYRAFCMLTVHEPVVEVSLNQSSYMLGIGNSYQLEATVSNEKTASNAEIEWYSEDPKICQVDKRGKITGLSLGTTVVTALSTDGSGAEASCKIEVVKEVTSIKLDVTTITLIVGEQHVFEAVVKPLDATYNTPLYESSNPDVALIDEDGMVTGLKAGTSMIKANAKDNSGKYAQCYVTVINPIPATGITLSDSEIVLAPGETKNIILSAKPTNTTDVFSWSSNNNAIAMVDNDGQITGITTGKCTITVMSGSGKKANVEVTVVGLSETELVLPVYSSYDRLYVDGVSSTVRWMVEDKSICQITNGRIITRKIGKTRIVATVNGRQLYCDITVTP